jgi:predicted nucleotide-binding protein
VDAGFKDAPHCAAMSELSNVMAKLSGVRHAVSDLINADVHGRGPIRLRSEFPPAEIQHYFLQTSNLVERLRHLLPDLYGDLQAIKTEPEAAMADGTRHFRRGQALALVRAIEQIFEVRANSELSPPTRSPMGRVFISHGRSPDWQKVQPFLEKDVKLKSLELAQEPSRGKTVIEKLEENADHCDSAVIVMTGDDLTSGEQEARVRENVMHEIGFFQARYGRQAVFLLHEEGVSIPSNLGGVVYIPFPKGNIEATFHVLQRELKALYHLS